MTSLKRLIAGTVSAALIGVNAGAVFAAQLPSDVAGTAYEEEAELLGALGIMVGDAESGNFRPDDNIRRSEFAKIAVTTIGLGNVADSSGNASAFPDVVENHWAKGYINTAVAHGLIIGDDNGNFRPDDNVSYAEVVTVLVRMLGHEPSAESKGQWPNGHLAVANSIGITKNVAAPASNAAVIRGIAAKLTFNSLTIDMMEQTGFGTDIKYEVVDKTILEDVLDVLKETGQITANEYTSLDSATGVKSGEVRMGSTVYSVGKTNAKNLLGYQVTLYSRENSADRREILAARATNRNERLSISAKNISNVFQQSSGSRTTLKYWEDKEISKITKTAYISPSAKLIYNGKAAAFSTKLLTPKCGSLNLLDTDRDGNYDIVFVTEYTNYVVDDTSTASYTVSDKFGQTPLVLDPSNTDVKFTIEDAEGQTVAFEDIKEWNVLSVTKSEDKNLLRVIVSTDSVSGKVRAIGENTVTIDDKRYEVADNYPTALNVNDEGVFFLDAEGRIAALDTAAAKSGNYAYLLAAAKSKGITGCADFKFFTKDGETVTVQSTDKIQFNGSSSKPAESVLATLLAGNGLERQLVTYETNSSGKLTKLNTAADRTSVLEYNKTFTKNYEASDVVYKSVSSKLGSFNISDNTVIFDIPEGETDSENYAVRNKDMFANDNKYNVSIYDMEEDLTASVVVVTNSNGKTSGETPIAVVEKIVKTHNDKGENVEQIYLTHNGKSTSYLGDKGGRFANLETGDIIQFKLNSRGEIDFFTLLCDVSSSDEFVHEYDDGLVTVHGKTVKKFANSVNVSVNGGSVENYTLKNVTVYMYDSSKSKNKVTVASAADIAKYDDTAPQTLFIRIYKDEVKEMVIIK